MRRLISACTLALLVFLVMPVVAHADPWFGSKVTVKTWTKTRTVSVTYHAYFDPSADGGTVIGNMGWWINTMWWDVSLSSPWDANWHSQTSVPQGVPGSPASIDGSASETLSKGDGTKSVYAIYKVSVVNMQLNYPISPVYSDTTKLDTHGPKTFAPSPAACAKGSKAVLKFKVTDNLSPKAYVTIVIRKGSKTVKTITATKRTKKSVSCSFKCKLAKGRYKFIVRAKDLAGNSQTKAGHNYLTVT